MFTALKVSGGPFEEKIGTEFINGVPEEYAEELKKGITARYFTGIQILKWEIS